DVVGRVLVEGLHTVLLDELGDQAFVRPEPGRTHVDDTVGDLVRTGAPADPVARLVDQYAFTGPSGNSGRGESRNSGTDDADVPLVRRHRRKSLGEVGDAADGLVLSCRFVTRIPAP